MKETIYLSIDMKKELDLFSINKEQSAKYTINNIFSSNKEDILDFINTKNNEVRKILKNRETTKTLDIEQKYIEYFLNENINIRVAVIIAIYLFCK